MDTEHEVDNQVVPTATTEETQEPSQNDAVAEELARVTQKESGRTKRDKLLYTKARVESQLAELDAEDGTQPDSASVDKSAPMTVAMYEQLQKETAQNTALQMADTIQDKAERELTKYHIENTIRTSGNPSEDLRLARALVNSVKNSQIVEEVARVQAPARHGSAPGAPARPQDKEPELTAEELSFMRPPFSLSKEQIVASRRG